MRILTPFLQVFVWVIPALSQDVEGGPISAAVFGGNNAEPGQFPFIGSLQEKTHDNPNGTHICGAVLIDKKWALTAAHCLCPSPYPSKVFFGDINLKQKSPSHHESRVLRAPHKYYDTTLENDIALIAIRDDVKDYNQNVSEVSLATSSDEISLYEKCFVAGWGYTSDENYLSDALQYAEVKLVNSSICKAKWWDFNETVICAQNTTSDACKGDSGGPLVCSKKSSTALELVGIVSYGVNVCMPGNPGVYTRVSAFQEWIAENRSTKPFLTIPLWLITVMFGYQLLEQYSYFILF
ncbi:Plasma kallikrein [Holothuria leucospilota]|uniref:Plasma kallikrein n=1 Tax=Holothuria leucospilota TaxID=206669 RepID=A0A9Q1BHR9_HOLLE|nr:Plasma kallikrein [Holothuria leucospilota]